MLVISVKKWNVPKMEKIDQVERQRRQQLVVMLSNCQNPVGIRFLIVIAIVCSIHTLDLMDGNTQHGNDHMKRTLLKMVALAKSSRLFLGTGPNHRTPLFKSRLTGLSSDWATWTVWCSECSRLWAQRLNSHTLSRSKSFWQVCLVSRFTVWLRPTSTRSRIRRIQMTELHDTPLVCCYRLQWYLLILLVEEDVVCLPSTWKEKTRRERRAEKERMETMRLWWQQRKRKREREGNEKKNLCLSETGEKVKCLWKRETNGQRQRCIPIVAKKEEKEWLRQKKVQQLGRQQLILVTSLTD